MNHSAFLGIGSNLKDRLQNISTVLRELAAHRFVMLERVSGIYETEPYGLKDQPAFLNCVAQVSTGMKPRALLAFIRTLESGMGRTRIEKWGPRVMDVDILFFDDLLMSEPGLTIPHADYLNRSFVLVPMAEITPGYVPPGQDVSVATLAMQCSDPGRVEKLEILARESIDEA